MAAWIDWKSFSFLGNISVFIFCCSFFYFQSLNKYCGIRNIVPATAVLKSQYFSLTFISVDMDGLSLLLLHIVLSTIMLLHIYVTICVCFKQISTQNGYNTHTYTHSDAVYPLCGMIIWLLFQFWKLIFIFPLNIITNGQNFKDLCDVSCGRSLILLCCFFFSARIIMLYFNFIKLEFHF